MHTPTLFSGIDADIAQASTLPPSFYRSAEAFALARERVFARSWQWLGGVDDVAAPESMAPRTLLPGLVDEPLLLVRDGDSGLRCLSNVCTHRGNLLVREACRSGDIRCGYHSRRFDLAGRMTFMPEFEGVADFPSARDNLPQLPMAQWGGHAFAALDPAHAFEDWMAALSAAMAWLPVERFVEDPARARDFSVAAHWALYVENYLEGFHIPFVHPGLAKAVDYGSYRTELFSHSVLQVAHARAGETAFTPDLIPPESGLTGEGHGAGTGAGVAAVYWWLFPNLMLNFYPWGLSVNLVLPQAPDRTRVQFRSFVHEAALLEQGAGAALERVEHEDEAIVEAVQRGVGSRLYRGGRYSPSREQGVHHFHRLLAGALA